MTETRYQRVAREQQERQATRAAALKKQQNAKYAAIRKEERIRRAGQKERRYLDNLVN